MENPYLRKMGHLFFLLFFLSAVFYFKERTLYTDNAYFLFNMVHHGDFFSASGRHSVFITQLLPLLLIKLKLPLYLVMVSYSVSFVLLYCVIFLVGTYVLRQEIIILPMILTLFLFSRESYFHIVTETHQGLMYTILFHAWLHYCREKGQRNIPVFLSVSVLLILLCYFSHPVTLFTLLFVLGFNFINEIQSGKKPWGKYMLLLVITGIIYLYRTFTTSKDSYDGQFYTGLFENLEKPFFSLYPLKFLYSHLPHFYIYVLPIALATGIIYISRKDYLKLSYVLISSLLFIAIVQLSFGNGDSDLMMEKNFMPLGVFIFIPFAYDAFRHIPSRSGLAVALVLLMVLSFGRIHAYSRTMSARVDFYRQLCDYAGSQNKRKLIIEEECVSPDLPGIQWALSVETLLYSSMYDRENSRSMHYNYREFNGIDIRDSSVFLYTPFWKTHATPNPVYFKLGHERYSYLRCQDKWQLSEPDSAVLLKK